MIRFELFANKSLQDDLVAAVERALPETGYTLFPVVHGKGFQDRKLGTSVWPEENFSIVCYVDEAAAGAFREAVRAIKAEYPTEGLVVYELGDASPVV